MRRGFAGQRIIGIQCEPGAGSTGWLSVASGIRNGPHLCPSTPTPAFRQPQESLITVPL